MLLMMLILHEQRRLHSHLDYLRETGLTLRRYPAAAAVAVVAGGEETTAEKETATAAAAATITLKEEPRPFSHGQNQDGSLLEHQH